MTDQRDEHGKDASLEGVASRLDALGAMDRAAAPVGLESRVLDRVGRVFVPPPITIGPTRAWWRSGTARAAAGLLLLVGVSALIYSRTQDTELNPLGEGTARELARVDAAERRIEGLLSLTAEGERFRDQVASIELWADAVSSEIGDAWIGSDLGFPGGFPGGLPGIVGGSL